MGCFLTLVGCAGFLPGIFSEGAKIYCYAISFVMLIFLLFSDQISGGVRGGGGGGAFTLVEESQSSLSIHASL